jgi:hypothetical protein
MGYRSDVQIAFYLTQGCSDTATYATSNDNPKPTLPFAALKFWFDETYPVHEAKDEWGAEITYGDDYILVGYRDVKWYPDYEHPKAVESAFEKCSAAFRSDERDHRAQYEMVRVGEESGDIETERSSYADCRIYVEHNIIFE